MENIKKLLVMMAIATLILSMAIATVSATSQVKNDKKDMGIVKIESKEKTIKYKITWKGNGGKIGSKTTVSTTVKKGSKIGKLTTPKRSGYVFKGWYTKKTGGTKISKNTKPKKSVTYYGQWKRASGNKNSNIDPKLIGVWRYDDLTFQEHRRIDSMYTFYKNGICEYYVKMGDSMGTVWEGKYYTNNGKIYLSNLRSKKFGTKWGEDIVVEYKFGTDKYGTYILSSPLRRDATYFKACKKYHKID